MGRYQQLSSQPQLSQLSAYGIPSSQQSYPQQFDVQFVFAVFPFVLHPQLLAVPQPQLFTVPQLQLSHSLPQQYSRLRQFFAVEKSPYTSPQPQKSLAKRSQTVMDGA